MNRRQLLLGVLLAPFIRPLAKLLPATKPALGFATETKAATAVWAKSLEREVMANSLLTGKLGIWKGVMIFEDENWDYTGDKAVYRGDDEEGV